MRNYYKRIRSQNASIVLQAMSVKYCHLLSPPLFPDNKDSRPSGYELGSEKNHCYRQLTAAAKN